MDPNQIAKTLVARRKLLKMKQSVLADLAGCSRATVIAAESGKPTLQLDVLVRIAGVLGFELTLQDRTK